MGKVKIRQIEVYLGRNSRDNGGMKCDWCPKVMF